MGKPTLVVMAAGLGSRYGGLKQIAPVDDRGQIIMDYSIYDAARAGFGKVVCVIKRELERDFREVVGDRLLRRVPISYAYQDIGRLPPGYRVPDGRQKPWGTGHAVLCAKEQISEPFCVINADDFYGAGAFRAIANFLRASRAAGEHAMVGYRVENTLTENGYVARGVCGVNADGMLTEIVERTRIEPCPGGAAYTEDDGASYTFIPAGTVVSMNLWGFQPSMLDELEARFAPWLDESLPANPLKCEYFLPLVPNALVRERKATVAVLPTSERWYGVTYRDDMAAVREAIAGMKRAGLYPDDLWR